MPSSGANAGRFHRQRVQRLLRTAHERDVEVIGFVVPNAVSIEPEVAATALIDLSGEVDEESTNAYRRFLAGIFSEEGARFIDLYPVMEAAKLADPSRKLYLDLDLHLTPEGADVVADALIRASGRAG